jgi:hypothetical protein
MHGLAPGHPVAQASHGSMLPAATATSLAAEADGYGTSTPCHRDQVPHHDLCKAVLTSATTSIDLTAGVALRPAVLRMDSATPNVPGACSGDPHPPDISRLGVLRI